MDPAFVVARLELRDWRPFVQHSFHVELQNGLAVRGLAALTLNTRDWRFSPSRSAICLRDESVRSDVPAKMCTRQSLLGLHVLCGVVIRLRL